MSATPSSGLNILYPMAFIRGVPGAMLVVAHRGPEGRARNCMLHHNADSGLRNFFCGDGGDHGVKSRYYLTPEIINRKACCRVDQDWICLRLSVLILASLKRDLGRVQPRQNAVAGPISRAGICSTKKLTKIFLQGSLFLSINVQPFLVPPHHRQSQHNQLRNS